MVERHAVADGFPADGAVHGAAVDVTVAELRRDRAGHGPLSGAGRTVDGDYELTHEGRRGRNGRKSGTGDEAVHPPAFPAHPAHPAPPRRVPCALRCAAAA